MSEASVLRHEPTKRGRHAGFGRNERRLGRGYAVEGHVPVLLPLSLLRFPCKELVVLVGGVARASSVPWRLTIACYVLVAFLAVIITR